MGLKDVRRRLPIVTSLPAPRSRGAYKPTPGTVPRPGMAVWEFTLACDQKCLHCGPRAGQRRAKELSTEEALALVTQLADAGTGEIVLIGG